MNDIAKINHQNKKVNISEMENNIKLTFTESEKTSKPISKHPNGKICILDHTSKKSLEVKPGEKWECSIIKEDERKLIVRPILLLVNSQETAEIIKNKLKSLQLKFNST